MVDTQQSGFIIEPAGFRLGDKVILTVTQFGTVHVTR